MSKTTQARDHAPVANENRAKSLNAFPQLWKQAPLGPPPKVHTPLFVWHLAMWDPVLITEHKKEALASQRSRLQRIDRFVANLYVKLANAQKSKTLGITDVDAEFLVGNELRLFGRVVALPEDGAEPQFSDLGEDVTLGDGQEQARTMRVVWFGLKVTFRFEVQAEIVTMTTYTDMSAFERVPGEGEASEFVTKNLTRLHGDLKELNGLFDRDSARHRDSARYKDISRSLYLIPRWMILDHLLGKDPSASDPFGTVFADFRGVVVSSPLEAHDAKKAPFLLPGWRKEGDATPTAARALTPPQWQDRLQALWPFLTTSPIKNTSLRKQEVSVSRMLGGRAMLATTLSLHSQGGLAEPLFYFIYSNGTKAWQTGRLIDTLAHLGTARLAALLNIERLHKVAPLLTVCETLIRNGLNAILSKTIEDQNQALSRLEKDERQLFFAKQRADTLADYLPRIGDSINDVTSSFPEQGPGRDNFERRIALSRAYIGKFRQNVGSLRIGLMEGFLPYDKFVERKLGGAYGLIDLISTRFGQIKADMNTLRQIEIAQRSRLAEETVSNFQRWADKALFLALLPYYVGEVLIEKILRMQDSADLKGDQAYVWAAVWFVFALFATERSRSLARTVWRTIRKPTWYLPLGLAMAAIAAAFCLLRR